MEPTVSLSRDQHIWSFRADQEPVVTVDPGTVIEIETWDCFTGQVTSEADTVLTLDLTRINSATGPIAVRGAEPGDSLSVTLLDIRPNTVGAAMVIPGWGQLAEKCDGPTTRLFRVEDGVIHMNERVSFPSRPMFGVIGVSPESGEIGTFFAGRHGGNMDDHMHEKGATIHLPVFQEGGQLSIGDMHASMGDGEISGTGVEIGGTALIKVDVLKGHAGGWPVTETADSFYTHGTSGSLTEPASIDEAFQIAIEEAAKLLVDQWGFTVADAFIFLSVAGDLGVAQNCHPIPDAGFVVARMRVPKLTATPTPFRL
jgi:amidase